MSDTNWKRFVEELVAQDPSLHDAIEEAKEHFREELRRMKQDDDGEEAMA